jgi:hypothetical protein
MITHTHTHTNTNTHTHTHTYTHIHTHTHTYTHTHASPDHFESPARVSVDLHELPDTLTQNFIRVSTQHVVGCQRAARCSKKVSTLIGLFEERLCTMFVILVQTLDYVRTIPMERELFGTAVTTV